MYEIHPFDVRKIVISQFFRVVGISEGYLEKFHLFALSKFFLIFRSLNKDFYNDYDLRQHAFNVCSIRKYKTLFTNRTPLSRDIFSKEKLSADSYVSCDYCHARIRKNNQRKHSWLCPMRDKCTFCENSYRNHIEGLYYHDFYKKIMDDGRMPSQCPVRIFEKIGEKTFESEWYEIVSIKKNSYFRIILLLWSLSLSKIFIFFYSNKKSFSEFILIGRKILNVFRNICLCSKISH